MPHSLPKLNYAYSSLEPFIDEKTMEIHHTKHHQTYIDKLNGVLEKYPELQEIPAEDLVKRIPNLKVEESDRIILKNNCGGHVNHAFFWTILGPKKEIDEKLKSEIADVFGSVDEFKNKFSDEAAKRFGSGWAWLVRKPDGRLEIYSTPNQDSPLTQGDTPVIGLDVWEHAYYLKYQNRRPDYIKNWWYVLTLI